MVAFLGRLDLEQTEVFLTAASAGSDFKPMMAKVFRDTPADALADSCRRYFPAWWNRYDQLQDLSNYADLMRETVQRANVCRMHEENPEILASVVATVPEWLDASGYLEVLTDRAAR